MAGSWQGILGSLFLTTQETVFLKLKPNTLEKARICGDGLNYRKHGRRVRYHIDDLTAWSDIHKRDTTANG